MPVNFGFEGEKATGTEPSGFRNYRDTFAIKSPLRASDSTGDTNSLVSEAESNLPELTQADERAIRLSGAQFAPIQEPAKDEAMSADYQKFSNWKPSADIARCIEGTSGPRHTREWDNDGFEVTRDSNQPEIELIPTQTRQSTPDSVMGTGRLVLPRRDNQSPVEVNRTNLQEHAAQNGHQRTLPSANGRLGVSMRHLVHAENMNVRENNSVASPDNVQLRPANPDEMDGALQRKIEAENKGTSFLVPKMVMFILALLIIIAGIVALIVTFKKNEYEGPKPRILPNPIPYVECPDVTVKLGEKVNFTCKFDLTHALRKSLVAYQYFTIAPIDRIISDESLKFYERNSNGNFVFMGDGWKAKCSTAGEYYVYLYDKDDTLLHRASVSIKIKSSVLNTTFEQHLSDTCPTDGEVKTYFKSTCFTAGDCRSYDPSIVRTSLGRTESLDHLMTCQSNFTDESGYSVNCSADIPEDLVTDYSQLRCRMASPGHHLERAFDLPDCGKTENCLSPTPEKPYPFNCSATSTHYGKLLNASCNFDALRECLQPGRKIFDLHKTIDGNLTCMKMKTTVPVCRLSWCVDYRYINKDIVPGKLICGGNFLEKVYSPPPTTLPPNTTNSG